MTEAVVVNVPLQGTPGDFEFVQALGERLKERVEGARVGEFDGDMIGLDHAIL